ncbi:MAG TPA: ATPase, T2SS/T4P/T4SS family [Candidatus Nanoarchaeia archaeon]|nr:ATPase, T2SS/T4P/T4SS family [Candidatus Nanoarchaeia archaeon]
MLSLDSQQKVEKLILQAGLLTPTKLDAIKQEAVQHNKSLLSVITDQKLVGEEDLVKIQAQAQGVPYVNLEGVSIRPDIVNLLSKDVAKNYMAVPFGRMQGKLAIAMLDPTNVQAADFIARKTGQVVITFMASLKSIEQALGQYKAELGDVGDALNAAKELDAKDDKPKSGKTLQTLVQDAPITRALNAILEAAVQQRASDIHIEPREKELKIRFRVDGILQDTMTLPKALEPALISRIKILSNLKIDEHRVPQDGEFQIAAGGQAVDLRIAIAPITWGEQVVIRLLNKDSQLLTLDSLGFKGRAFRVINEGIHRPHGMTLATGPTGSGKSTTLYAVIQEIKNVAINIVTLEDPVEYKMDGINQIQVNGDVGLTFASGLRSILRQDPNVVMVGEIRDKETADLAVQAALTGHVVLSTLHTNSAPGVLPRLLDMAVEPFLIASTVNTVIGQRLVRRLCDVCHQEVKSSETETQSISETLKGILPKSQTEVKAKTEDLGYEILPIAGQSAYTFYKANPEGCDKCMKGYRGRIGIYEVFAMTDGIEKLLSQHAPTTHVQAQAQADGMLTMKQDGYLKVLNGITTLEEVARVAADY